MDQNCDLFSLMKIIYDTLTITEEVKNVLNAECIEARFALKPWQQTETVVTKKIHENICTCRKTLNFGAEEISLGIDKTLSQTRKLREKFNVKNEKKHVKGFNECNIRPPNGTLKNKSEIQRCESVKPSSTACKDIKDSSGTTKKDAIVSSPNNPPSVAKQKSICTKKIQKESVCHNEQNVLSVSSKSSFRKSTGSIKDGKQTKIEKVVRKSISNVKLSAPPIYNNLISKYEPQSREKKNFLAINKLNVKHMKKIEKPELDASKKKVSCSLSIKTKKETSLSQKAVSSKASTSELSNLIQKLSETSYEQTSFVQSNVDHDYCPLHKVSAVEYTKKLNSRSMDLMSSLRNLDIPEKIMKTLRLYHMHLKTEFSNKYTERNASQKINKFIMEFEKYNENEKQCLLLTDTTSLNDTVQESISVFENALNERLNVDNLYEFEKISTKLNHMCQIYEKDKSFERQRKNITTEKKELCNFLCKTRWMSNGIWNISSIKNLEGITKIHCIRYSNNIQLLTLFKTIQELQQTQYLKHITDLILKDILPKVISPAVYTNAEYIEIYKMIAIISQGLNPKVPILVKVEE